MTTTRWIVAVLLGLASSIAAAPAVAQPDAAKAAAPAKGSGKAEFAAGRAKFLANDFAGALPQFQKALELSGSPNAALYVGLCLLELNQPVDAYDMLTRAAHDATERVATDASYAHTRDVATQNLGTLDKRVARVTITVRGPKDAAVTLNGKPVPAVRLGAVMAVMPGNLSFVAKASGVAPVTSDVTVLAGEDRQVVLRFASADGGDVLAPATMPPSGGDSTSGMTPLRKGGIAVAGLGVVGIGIFAIAGLMADSDFSSVKAACNGRCTGTSHDSDISRGRTLDTLANVGLVVGVLGLAGGGAMIGLGGKSSTSSGLVVSPGALSWRGRF